LVPADAEADFAGEGSIKFLMVHVNSVVIDLVIVVKFALADGTSGLRTDVAGTSAGNERLARFHIDYDSFRERG
jgi:hypothetical protein